MKEEVLESFVAYSPMLGAAFGIGGIELLEYMGLMPFAPGSTYFTVSVIVAVVSGIVVTVSVAASIAVKLTERDTQ